jgi:tetratricopeptide (TPR) repeat protein
MQKSKAILLAFCASLILIGTACTKLKARDQLNKGVQAYRNNKYSDAVNHFKQAVELDPSNESARLYLATSYMIQWIPGADSPDNKKNYDMAQQTFQQVLDKNPKDKLALASMASMAYQSASSGTPEQKDAALDQAKKWNERRSEVDPKDSEPYY